jgi:hypothetical protein
MENILTWRVNRYILLLNIGFYEWKQVGLKTGFKRAAGGGIAAAMLKLNGFMRSRVKFM